MLLFVGLGNPNPNNSNNRHNVGFSVIDAINSKFKLAKQKPKSIKEQHKSSKAVKLQNMAPQN